MEETTEKKIQKSNAREKISTSLKRECTKWKCCRTLKTRGLGGCLKKFFWEGQIHNKVQEAAMARLCEDMPWHKQWLIKYRRLIGLLIPGVFVHILWWSFFTRWNYWHLFTTGYKMSITMIFGSLIAGMTSEGGGAVAFPVMTLAMSIAPKDARDFSLMIQAFGMTCAAFSILFMRIKLETSSLIFCTTGGWIGIVFGFHLVDPHMTPPQKKMFFVSVWFAFAFALFLLNRYHKRKTFRAIPNMNWWRAIVLICTGFMGGIFTSFAGSGLDICSFAVLTLLFRVSEKVATPTSVVLMGGCSVFGFYWRTCMMEVPPAPLSWEFLAVCIPIVVIGAPLGSLLGSHFHRLVLACLVYVVDTTALVAAFVLIPQTPLLGGVSVAIIVGGFFVFLGLTKLGQLLLKKHEQANPQTRIPRRNTDPGAMIKTAAHTEIPIDSEDIKVRPGRHSSDFYGHNLNSRSTIEISPYNNTQNNMVNGHSNIAFDTVSEEEEEEKGITF